MKGKLFLSVLLGSSFAVISLVICLIIIPELAFGLALFSGCLTALLLHIYFDLVEKQHNKRYEQFEKRINRPVFYKTNGNFNLGKKVRNGNIYLTEVGILFACLDERPHAVELVLFDNIMKYEFDNIHMKVCTKESRVILVTLSDADTIMDELKKKIDYIIYDVKFSI